MIKGDLDKPNFPTRKTLDKLIPGDSATKLIDRGYGREEGDNNDLLD